jgi:putative tryptophan/tyrosine transport system substrate-binding protein
VIGRREFIAGLGGAAAWPLAARAQRPTMPVVGWLRSATAVGSEHFVAGFRQGLSEAGFVEGQNVRIEYRWANNQLEQLPGLAADLVRRQVTVIAAMGTADAAQAAIAVTKTIPIVFWTGLDPVGAGLVPSLNRPGGNATGIASFESAFMPKRFDLFAKLVPQAATIFGLVTSQRRNLGDAMHMAARTLGRELIVLEVQDERDFETAFATLAERRALALFVTVDPVFTVNRSRLIGLAARYRIPASYGDRDYAIAGGLMSYGANLPDINRQAGVYVGRILKGEKPADLPVLQPAKLELVINLKTARTLGLELPPTLVAIADEVIE